MLKQTITYTDFNGTQRTEDLYFNLTEFELVEIQAESERGIQADLQDAIKDKDLRRLLAFIKMLVNKAYGVKSEDGKHFEKSDAILLKFQNSALYSDLLLNLFEDEGARAEKFITGLMPKELIARAAAKSQGQSGTPAGYAPDARELNARHVAGQNIPEAVFEEAPAIGKSTDLSFQAPPATLPSKEFYEERSVPPHQQAVQPDPATVDARVESPILPGGYTETSRAEEHKPFRVKETPLDQVAAEVTSPSDEEQAAFKAWQAEQRAKRNGEQS